MEDEILILDEEAVLSEQEDAEEEYAEVDIEVEDDDEEFGSLFDPRRMDDEGDEDLI
jgi:hypothetical protein